MSTGVSRPDQDIYADIIDVIVRYPPLQADRRNIHITVQDGEVQISGVVRTVITRQVLLERAARVAGVRKVTADALTDDETLRLAVGELLPAGVMANVAYGTVALSSVNADAGALEQAAQRIIAAGLTGLRRVVAARR